MSRTPPQQTLSQTSPAASSPFVVGRPLRPEERIFGRQAAFRFIADELASLNSVNIVGERRMGKTSLLNHLVAHSGTYLTIQQNTPPIVLARIDFQAGINNERRFYGAFLHSLLAVLPSPPRSNAEVRGYNQLAAQLAHTPEATYDKLHYILHKLHDQQGMQVRPVVIIDEFERLLDPTDPSSFPYPQFFDGLRAFLTADLLAIIVASRRPLAEYFSDPSRPGGLTSSFPTYFQPFELTPLDDTATDTLLLQRSPFQLNLNEVDEIKRWAQGHPCYLQIAGAAQYQAKAGGHDTRWVQQRREELKRQNCMVINQTGTVAQVGAGSVAKNHPWIIRALHFVVWNIPYTIGRMVQRLGGKFDEMAAWLIGLGLIILVILLLIGAASRGDVLQMVQKALGLSE